MRYAGLLLAAAALAAGPFAVLSCPTPPRPPPPPPTLVDGAPAPSCASACERLRYLGCPEGTNASCEAVCQHVLDTHLTPLDIACLSAAGDVVSARSCAGLHHGCPR